jgi:hypothetical protein
MHRFPVEEKEAVSLRAEKFEKMFSFQSSKKEKGKIIKL